MGDYACCKEHICSFGFFRYVIACSLSAMIYPKILLGIYWIFSTSIPDAFSACNHLCEHLWKITQVKELTNDPTISMSALDEAVGQKLAELEALNAAMEVEVD